jgi:excisionase family DNA binding protein
MSLKTSVKSYLTPKEVAELLMVSTAAVRLWAERGQLKARVTAGGHRRV